MRAEMICYFQKLVDDLKNGSLSPKQEKKMSEFYLEQKFINEKKENLSEKEIMKYAALGWYVYNYNKKD